MPKPTQLAKEVEESGDVARATPVLKVRLATVDTAGSSQAPNPGYDTQHPVHTTRNTQHPVQVVGKPPDAEQDAPCVPTPSHTDLAQDDDVELASCRGATTTQQHDTLRTQSRAEHGRGPTQSVASRSMHVCR